jgi:hypothetical protein
MKSINHLNIFAIGLPFFILLTYPIYNDLAIYYSLYSTMVTGFIQILLGLIMLYREPRNKSILIYIFSVIIFFTLWYLNIKLINSDNLGALLFIIPPTLAIYLSIIIYKKY